MAESIESCEVWKGDLTNFSKYEFSSLGRVRTKKTGYIRKLIPRATSGYIYTAFIRDDGETKQCSVHRLIALTFLDRSPEKTIVNHINGVRSDNRVTNLEWVTHKENSDSTKSQKSKTTSAAKAVLQFDKNGNFIKQWRCSTDAAKCYGVTRGAIENASAGRSKTSAGYVWKYKELNVIEGEKWVELCIDDQKAQVSDHGRIQYNNHISTGGKGSAGYLQGYIGRKKYMMHVLVYRAFKTDYDPDLTINHIDGDKRNNLLTNLEQVTVIQNINHAYDTGLNRGRIGNGRKVEKLDLQGNIVAEYESLTSTAQALECSLTRIYNIINNPTNPNRDIDFRLRYKSS